MTILPGLLLAASVQAACLDELPVVKGECRQQASCPYRCCRKPFDAPEPCDCDACCVGFEDKQRLAPAAVRACRGHGRDCDKAQQLLRGLAEELREKGRLAEAEARCAELKGLKPALERGLLRHGGRSVTFAGASVRFHAGEDGAGKPAAVLRFEAPPAARAAGGTLALCGDPPDFCGVTDFAGNVLYTLALRPGQRAEPAAVEPEGRDAVFEVWRLEDGKWVLDHYAVWAKPHSPAISELRRRHGDELYPQP